MEVESETDWSGTAKWIDTVFDLVRAAVDGDPREGGLRRTYGDVSIVCDALPIGDVAFVLQRGGDFRFGFFELYAVQPRQAASRLLEAYIDLRRGRDTISV